MQSVKEKVSNAASAGQEHVEIYKAKVQEKAEKATARTKEEEVIAHEKRKAKEAEAKMKLHDAKAEHAAEKLYGKHSLHLHRHRHRHPTVGDQGHHRPVEPIGPAAGQGHPLPAGTHVAPATGTMAPTYPPGLNTYI